MSAVPPTAERAASMIDIQAVACAKLGSPLYGMILRHAADDVRHGGPCAAAIAGYEHAPGPDAIALRLLGGVHALVLTGDAPQLAEYYPSTGGRYDDDRAEACWLAFRATVAAKLDPVRRFMTSPPQTNEVGRANLLMLGLMRTLRGPGAAVPVRLFELGCSAGLNLRADHFRYEWGDLRWGPADSPVILAGAWRDTVPDWLAAHVGGDPLVAFQRRHGCDLRPIDPCSGDGALALRAYVWPDQPDRLHRLDGALRLAARVPADVEALGAAEFLSRVRLEPGTLTVVWHSVMRQYVPAEEWALVEGELARLAAASGAGARFAHVCFEPRRAGERHRFQLTVAVDGGALEVLAEASPHGLPARLPKLAT